MHKSTVSIVVPIYNVEKYLDRCIESLVNQTYKNLEILLIDDGSPDNCPKMCDDWAQKDKRIKVIHKKNAGLGMARNTGIENATGEYICFVDSDDYIDLQTVELAYSLIQKEKSQIVTYGFNLVDENGNLIKKRIPYTGITTYEGQDVKKIFLPDFTAPNTATGKDSNLCMSACAFLGEMKLIKDCNWRFVSEREIISEDAYSLLVLYKYVNKVSILSEPLYYYCVNQSSLTHTFRKERYEKIKHFYDVCIKLCDDSKFDEEVKKRIAYLYISNTIAALKMIVKSDLCKKDRKKEFKKIILDEHLQNVIKSMNVKKEKNSRKILLMLMKMKLIRISYMLIKIKA